MIDRHSLAAWSLPLVKPTQNSKKMKKAGLLKRLAPNLRRAFTRIDLMGENGLGAFQ